MSAAPRYLRPSLHGRIGYVPGETADTDWVCLNTNESPLPPSPAVVAAIAAAAADVRRYPHPRAEPLRGAIAAHHGVTAEQVLVGAGADGVLTACFRAFCEPGSRVAVEDPTYPVLHDLASHFSVVVSAAPDDDAIVTFVVNPSVPTGRWREPADLRAGLADRRGVVVIDEVYAPFAPASMLPCLADHPNWLVVRSFSKAYALAGLRVGYAVGAPDLIAALATAQDPYPVSHLAIAGGVAALADDDAHRAVVAMVRRERSRLSQALAGLGWDAPPSEGNFVFARPPDGDVDGVVDRLREHRILVRRFPSIDTERVRITVGSQQDNDRLLAALVTPAPRPGTTGL
jgi:histidinol-phosphate aminotransferase